MTTIRDLLNDFAHEVISRDLLREKTQEFIEREKISPTDEDLEKIQEELIEEKLEEYTGLIKERIVG